MPFSLGNGLRLILRLEIRNTHSILGDLATAIGAAGGDIMAVDLIQAGKEAVIRDITIGVETETAGDRVVAAVRALPHVRVINVSDRVFLAHLGGKIEVAPRFPIKNRDDLSMVYTPGVARVCSAIRDDPHKAFSLTMKRNTVAVVTDGSAVLGLGNIGSLAALPALEGKAMLFKQFGGVDAVPICLDVADADSLVATVRAIAPGFGAISLAGLAAPDCFAVEDRLRVQLPLPVCHDDLHGVAVVVLAGLINACKIVDKELSQIRVVVAGAGATGVAIIRLLLEAGIRHIVAVDAPGILAADGGYANPLWAWAARHTDAAGLRGDLADALRGADVFLGAGDSGAHGAAAAGAGAGAGNDAAGGAAGATAAGAAAGSLTVSHLRTMARDAVVFLLSTPDPGIEPEAAGPHVRVLATGRSDYPNQVTSLLYFPGLFRGVLDCRARAVNAEMRLAAARAIAAIVSDDELSPEYIIPSVFNRRVVDAVSMAVMEAAYATGVARRERRDLLREGRDGRLTGD